jgi:hypothetical protein
MKLPLTIATLLLSLIAFTPIVTGQTATCSCKAPGSCTPRVSCPHGCTALCGANDACYAGCGSIEADNSYARITLKIHNKDSEAIAASLSNQSGRKITFIPRKKTDRFSFELNNDPVWNALNFLAKRGTILVDGWDFEKLEELRRKMLKGEKISVNFTDVPVRNAVAKLSFLSGLPFRVESGDAEKNLSISLQEVTLSEIVSRISAETGVKIEQREERVSIK